MSQNRQFRNFFLNTNFQFRVVFTTLCYMFVVVIATAGATLLPLVYDMYYAPDITEKYNAAQLFLVMARRLVPTITGLFILLFFHLIFITHKICGPLVNFSNTFKRVRQLDFSRRVILRKGDYLKREGEMINEMIDGVATVIQTIQLHNQKVSQAVEVALKDAPDDMQKEHLEKILREVKSASDKVASEFGRFSFEEKHRD